MYDGNNTPSGMGEDRTCSETVTDNNDQSEIPNEGLYTRNRKGTCRDHTEMELENDVFEEPINDKQETSQSKTKLNRRGRPKRNTHNPPTEKKEKN